MAVANYNRKILDLKRWTMTTAPAPVASAAGSFVISSRLSQQRQLFMVNATTHYLYYPFEDAFIQIPSGALAGTFGAGSHVNRRWTIGNSNGWQHDDAHHELDACPVIGRLQDRNSFRSRRGR